MPDEQQDTDWPSLYAEHLEVWDKRIAEALSLQDLDGVVVFSGTEKPHFRDDDNYPFFPEPYFKAWIPRAHPDSALCIVPGERPKLLYVRSSDYWHAPAEEPDDFWTTHFEILAVENTRTLYESARKIDGRIAAIGDAADGATEVAIKNDPALLSQLDYQRAFKTAYEIECIASANRVAAAGHAAARGALTERISEFDLNQTYCTAVRHREFELPYMSIVALNEHAGTLHYQNLDRQAPSSYRSFLLDAGAQYSGYASDVTRTWSGEEDAGFSELIASMDEMQKRLCAGARNRVSFVALNDLAHRMLADVLERHELIRCGAEEAFDRGITRSFLPHGLGHLLGLQVHDPGGRLHTPDEPESPPPEDHPFLRLTRTLEPGVVVTIEPGLYFIPLLLERLKTDGYRDAVNWSRIEQLLPFGGIRIEDNVVVTDAGSRNLSRPALQAAGIN